MRKPKPHDTTPHVPAPLLTASGIVNPLAANEGGVLSPPRFASQAIDDLSAPHQVEQPHLIEQAVQRELLAHPSLRFASLVVRRIDNGVCLQGVLEADDESPDVCRIARRVAGVRHVLNRLVIAPRRAVPVKG